MPCPGLACPHSAPTYILSECVLVYMDPGESSRVVGWLARTFQAAAAMAIYEQVRALLLLRVQPFRGAMRV